MQKRRCVSRKSGWFAFKSRGSMQDISKKQAFDDITTSKYMINGHVLDLFGKAHMVFAPCFRNT